MSLHVILGSDLAGLVDIKNGVTADPWPAEVVAGGLVWTDKDFGVRVVADPIPARVTAAPDELCWELVVPAHGSVRVTVDVVVSRDPAAGGIVGADGPVWSVPQVAAGDHRLVALLDQSIADLHGLLMSDPAVPGGVFLAAGSPWFLTLFGRDSLIAARLLLPLGTDLALGTLRVLAARQGRVVDAATGEEPGKIAHELRRAESAHSVDGRVMTLPPLYYGTVDATALWVMLLHDAWRWGLPDADVAALLDHLEAALGWLRDWAIGPSGFVEYVDRTGSGLANQGWKDSGDSIRFADGRLARAPVALCEVQGYAYQAAVNGAAILTYFGRPGGPAWLDWAARLRKRFREEFWVGPADHRYPAMALDADRQPVDAVASNMGHLLGTGLLDDDEITLVVDRLAGSDLNCGHGLRTLSAASVGFNPIGYHTGSVWPHDTAVAIAGLTAEGRHAAAAVLIDGLLRAAPAFDFRLPELFGGGPVDGTPPLPYPAACRPQAWAAAAAVGVLGALAGLTPDVPRGTVAVRPVLGSGVGALTVRGLRVAGTEVTVAVRSDGRAEVSGLPAGLRSDQ